MKIGRRELHASIEEIEQIIGDEAFHGVAIAVPQSHPQAVQFRSTEKSLAFRLERIVELAHEVNGLQIRKWYGAVFSVQGEQVNYFGAA